MSIQLSEMHGMGRVTLIIKKDEVNFFKPRTFKGGKIFRERNHEIQGLNFVNDLLTFHSQEQISTDR